MTAETRIEIKTPARLHLGLLDTNGELGRLYGSIGVTIDRPNVVLEAEPADKLAFEGLETDRVSRIAHRFVQRYPLTRNAKLNLKKHIPFHVGLGSGTQLALAVGTALARLSSLALSPTEIAVALGRCQHSGIGVSAFQRGGFILDGGHRVPEEIPEGWEAHQSPCQTVPPILFRRSVPPGWRFVVVIPPADPGISGEREQSAFQQLPAAPPALADKICRLILMKMLPALMESDIHSFGAALTEIQRLVGDCFAAVQGGRFGNPLSDQLISFLLERGANGAGQSSWGPTVYGLVEEEASAQVLEAQARRWLEERQGGEIFIARPANQGARVRLLQPEEPDMSPSVM